jgi:hypothetical protein
MFDGGGYKIAGLWINRPKEDSIALFGYTDPTAGNIIGVADYYTVGLCNEIGVSQV